MNPHSSIPLVAIVGPTAVGKTALALRLASAVGGEVISADSRQVYRRMDIGTAKPSARDRVGVPHHLIDVVEPDDDYSLARFLKDATQAIQNVNCRSRTPVLAGGSGQYIWGLLEGWTLPPAPPDPLLRERLNALLASEGLDSLRHDLLTRDPTAAARIDLRNPRRVIRALEVSFGARPGENAAPSKRPPPYRVKVIGLTLSSDTLYKRIDDRVDSMIQSGWIDEVGALLDSGYAPRLPSMSGLGYRELVSHLRGDLFLDDAVIRIKHNTHKFARRQRAWFKPTDERIHWFDAAHGLEPPQEAAQTWLDTHAGP